MSFSSPDVAAEISTVAQLLERRLIQSGKLEEAAAFRRQIAPSFKAKPRNYAVGAGKDALPKILDNARKSLVSTISERAKLEDAVLVIGIEQLALDLAEIAVGFEQSHPAARHPRSMFVAVDRLPSVPLAEVEIDLSQETPLPTIEMP